MTLTFELLILKYHSELEIQRTGILSLNFLFSCYKQRCHTQRERWTDLDLWPFDGVGSLFRVYISIKFEDCMLDLSIHEQCQIS